MDIEKSISDFENEDHGSMSIGDHLNELRARVILALIGLAAAFIICLFFGWQLVDFFAAPLMAALDANGQPRSFLATGVATGFSTYIKVSLVAALFVAAPWVFYQLWQFVASGLYRHERKLVNIFAPFSALLFILGGLFFIYVVAPVTINFFLNFNAGLKVNPHTSTWFNTILSSDNASSSPEIPASGRFFLSAPVPFCHDNLVLDITLPASNTASVSSTSIQTHCTINEYISFILTLTVAFGASFQMPLAVFLTGFLGLVTIDRFRKVRKYVFLAIIVSAAIITPPDILSQLAMAFPMYLLYELGIFLLVLMPPKSKKVQQ